jgi:hypothetical protein
MCVSTKVWSGKVLISHQAIVFRGGREISKRIDKQPGRNV